MKLIINFDLIEKIKEAKTGFSLTKTAHSAIKTTALVSPLHLADNILLDTPLELSILEILIILSVETLLYSTTNLLLSKSCKKIANSELRLLSLMLKNININTNSKLLLNSYSYQTNYSISFDKIPQLEQKKYIIIPVIENGEEKELSVLQEHIIGTSKYILSVGEPDKLFKLALSQA